MTPPSATLLEAPAATEPTATADTSSDQQGEPAPTATPDVTPTPQVAPPKRRRFRSFVTLLLVLAVIGTIAVAAVLGWPTIRGRVYEGVDANTADIQSLAGELTEADQTIADLQIQIDALGERQAAVPTRLDELETNVGDLNARADTEDTTVAGIEAHIAELDASIAGIDEAVSDLATTSAAGDADLGNRLEVTGATELLSRARLFLYQANYGLAIGDLTMARTKLERIDPAVGGIAAETRDAAVARISLALASLPDRPVLAADDLDIAWQLLVDDTAVSRVASLPPVPIVFPEETTPAATDTEPATPEAADEATPEADAASGG